MDIHKELRLCRTCNLSNIENEYCFLFDCAPLQSVHSAFYIEDNINLEQFMAMPDADNVQSLLTEECVKRFVDLVAELYLKCRDIIYKHLLKGCEYNYVSTP